jgi:AcrR family transcriptional regulator
MASGSRVGGRSARVRSSVLRAAEELVTEVGYEAMSIEQVAERAGVHKTTVYRRWPTKAELVMAAVEERSETRVPVPDTGSLGSDLTAFARAVVANLRAAEGRTLARTLVVAAGGSEELRAAASRYWAQRFGVAAEMVDRARARGEIPAATDADAVIETLIGPLYVRVLLTDGPIDRRLADRSAAATAAMAEQGLLVTP